VRTEAVVPHDEPASIAATVWDLPLRIFHWALVLLFAIAYFSGIQPGYYGIHKGAGYAILGLLVFRLIWGFIGPGPARFVNFLKGPAAVSGHLKELLHRQHRPLPGHNPLGGWAVLAILVLVAVQTVSGLFAATFDYEGPLARLLSDANQDMMAGLHALTINLLLALVAVHLVGIAATSFLGRENLVASMIHGRKQLAVGDLAAVRLVSWWRAVLAMAAAAFAVLLILVFSRLAR
jgi:cytochrome b